MAHGTRMPRNEVADFILSDLDKAIELLQNQGFASNNRINKQVALLVKSRVALYEPLSRNTTKEQVACRVMPNGRDKKYIRTTLWM